MLFRSFYQPLKRTGQEPEYKITSRPPISSIGTDYTTADETNLPAGSALMTDTLDGSGNGMSQLHSKGITHIIHAAPKPRSSFSTDQDFINCVVKSVQNSIVLTDREDIQKQIETNNEIAICLVGGGIYLGSCDLEELADRARAVVARGYKAFKFDPFGPGGRDMPRQELRQAPLKWRP